MSMRYWEPGWVGVLEDGTRVKTIVSDRVPGGYWNEMVRLTGAKLEYIHVWVVGRYADGAWNRASEIPERAFRGGDIKYPGTDYQTTVVPISFLDPEVNEWGVVSP